MTEHAQASRVAAMAIENFFHRRAGVDEILGGDAEIGGVGDARFVEGIGGEFELRSRPADRFSVD